MLFTFNELHTVVASTMSNPWLCSLILVCSTALRMNIWYDYKYILCVHIPVLEVDT